MKNNKRNTSLPYILGAMIFLLLLILPLVVHDQYVLHILINIILVNISVLGVRLILLTGRLSLGQAAFVAIGAYASAILVTRLGFSTWLALPLAGLTAALLGAAIGWPALRQKGIYFVMITICMGEATIHYIANLDFLTGGLNGISGIPRPNSIKIGATALMDFSSGKSAYYYYALAMLIFSVWVMLRIDKSRLGAMLRAVAANDRLAESTGMQVLRLRVLGFAIACFFSGIAGAFYAHYYVFLQPNNFTTWDSIYYMVYVAVGGVQSVFGPIIGCLLMLIVFEVSRDLADFQPAVYGSILIMITLFLPQGLASLKDRFDFRIRGIHFARNQDPTQCQKPKINSSEEDL